MKSTIHKKFAVTLVMASLFLSVLFGGGGLLLEFFAMEKRIIEFATLEAKKFTEQRTLNRQGENLETSLRTFLADRTHAPNGHLVAVKILSSAARVLADADDGTNASIAAARRYTLDIAKGNKPDHEVFWDDSVYVKVLVPLRLYNVNQTAFFSGLFHVDQKVVALLQSKALKTVGITVLIVILTALFIYPLVLYLDRNLTRRTQQLLEANTSMLEALGAAIAKRDSDTGAHNYRVTYYSIRLGEAAGLSRTQIVGLLKGAFLHDIGKIGVPDAILLKPGKLTVDEFVEMQTHVRHGLDIVNDVTWFNDAAEVIGGHHEKWDGSGYPQGLRGDDIPLSARIFAIADVFDALTSRRPYKEAFSVDKAETIMVEGRDQHFDPHLLDLFLTRSRDIYDEITNQDDAALKKTLMSCTCRYLDATA